MINILVSKYLEQEPFGYEIINNNERVTNFIGTYLYKLMWNCGIG